MKTTMKDTYKSFNEKLKLPILTWLGDTSGSSLKYIAWEIMESSIKTKRHDTLWTREKLLLSGRINVDTKR